MNQIRLLGRAVRQTLAEGAAVRRDRGEGAIRWLTRMCPRLTD